MMSELRRSAQNWRGKRPHRDDSQEDLTKTKPVQQIPRPVKRARKVDPPQPSLVVAVAESAEAAAESERLRRRGLRLLVKGTLGAGKYSRVVRALLQTGIGSAREVALKIVDLSLLRPHYFSRFLSQELANLADIRHPHILRLHHYFSEGPRWYLVLELAEGGDLLSYVQRHGAVPEAQCRLWMRQLVAAIAYLHALPIAHRDVKLENILMTLSRGSRSLKLGDFGFSKRLSSVRELSETFCGSRAYSCQEILRGVKFCPLTGDVFALGVVAFILLTARMPFTEKDSTEQLVLAQLHRRYTYPARLPISARAMEVVDWMLSFQGSERPTACVLKHIDWLQSDWKPPLNREAKQQSVELGDD